VTPGVTARVRISFSISSRIAFVLTLVSGSGIHLGLRFRSGFVTFKVRVRARDTVRVKCWGWD